MHCQCSAPGALALAGVAAAAAAAVSVMSLGVAAWSWLDLAVRSLNPSIADVAPTGVGRSVAAFWLVPPAQTAVDFAVWTSLGVFLLTWPSRLRTTWVVASPARVYERMSAADFVLAAVDGALSMAAWATLAFTIWLKLSTGRAVFLLQPCHISNLLLCMLTLASGQGRWRNVAARAFWIDLLAKYGTAAALIVPDIGPTPAWGEVACFFVQHWVLCLLPAVWLLRRRFDVFVGTPGAVLFAWAAVAALHFGLLLPVSVFTGRNVNYMMAPPRGAYPAAFSRTYYRSIIAAAGVPIAAAVRALAVAPLTTLGIALTPTSEPAGDDVPVKKRSKVEDSQALGEACSTPGRRRRGPASLLSSN